MDVDSPLQRAVKIVGGQSALGRAVGVSQQAVWNWLRMPQVPAEYAPKIEAATDGQVTRSDLRPDLWPPPQERAA